MSGARRKWLRWSGALAAVSTVAGLASGSLRFGLLLLLLGSLIGLVWSSIGLLAERLAPAIDRVAHRLMRLGGGRRGIPWSTAERAAAEVGLGALLLLTGALLLGLWTFFELTESLLEGEPLATLDRLAYHLLDALRSPAGEHLMVAITVLGDAEVIVPVVSGTAATLALLGAWRVAGHLLVVVLGGLVWVSVIKLTLQRPRPVDVYEGISAFAFPSGHATTSIVVYGFLGFLLIRGAAPERRTPIAAPLLALIVAIAFSRIYLGVHWVSDVLAGVAFGGAWVALSALLHLRWQPAPLPFRPLALAVAVTLAAAGGWHIAANHGDAMARYTTAT